MVCPLLSTFYGSRRIGGWLWQEGNDVNSKHVQRLMHQMEIAALYPKKGTTRPGKGHKIYPCLLEVLGAIARIRFFVPISPIFQWPKVLSIWW